MMVVLDLLTFGHRAIDLILARAPPTGCQIGLACALRINREERERTFELDAAAGGAGRAAARPHQYLEEVAAPAARVLVERHLDVPSVPIHARRETRASSDQPIMRGQPLSRVVFNRPCF